MAGNKGIVPVSFYRFNAANRTITFSNDYAGLDLAEITYITNIKNGVATVIYDPFDPTKGGTLSGLTLTLAFDTTSMSDSDPLQIITGFTPLEADPLPVRIVEGPDQKDDTELLNRIADGVDYLNLSLDTAEGIQVNTREINPARRDLNNAQVLSDAISTEPAALSPVTGRDTLLVDTQGYSTVVLLLIGLSNSQVIFEQSADQSTWVNCHFSWAGATIPAANVSGTGTFVMNAPAQLRYVRVRLSSGGNIIARFTLRASNLQLLDATGGSFVKANITAYNGTALSTAQQVDAAGNLASAGNFAIGSSYVGTTNRPNAASTLATGVPYPISIGGREQPYIGALAGVFRHITVDGGGRYILGGDTPDTETRFQSKLASGAIPGIPPRGVGGVPNSMQGSQALTITDVAQDFGDTQVMLLRQILTELKILNQQFAEMPQLLNQANFTMSDPQEYRNDGDFDSSIQ